MYVCYVYFFVAQVVPDEELAKKWVSENPSERWYEFKHLPSHLTQGLKIGID